MSKDKSPTTIIDFHNRAQELTRSWHSGQRPPPLAIKTPTEDDETSGAATVGEEPEAEDEEAVSPA